MILRVIFYILVFGFFVAADYKDNDMQNLKSNMIETVKHLSETIGPRDDSSTDKLDKSADYIEAKMRSYGCNVKKQPFTFADNTYYNVICEVKGTEKGKNSILVVGAHYDTVATTPGADDNASAVAGMLELARLTSAKPIKHAVRFVAFCLEEPPAFRTKNMGSYVYAESLKKEGADVYGMISLEMIGYFSEEKGSQYYPFSIFKWFYPDKGNFISFVGNFSSRSFTKQVEKEFKAASTLPIESVNTFSAVPGIDFSDHLNFWEFGYPAFMITDTSFYRNPNYHMPSDTAETLDYDKMSELVSGLYKALGAL
jgi:hypothetical protein